MTTATSGIYIGQNRPLVSRLVGGGAAVRAGVGQVHCSVWVSVVGIDMIDVSIVVNVYVLVWELLSMVHFAGSLVSVVGTSSVLVEVFAVALGFVTVSVTVVFHFILSLERLDTRPTH